ncbi:MAG: potassium-transporting ATPase potassium-binding subunit [Thermoproteota archaeon]|nr:potassium-transporting ATPase potassium-binding subunit [Thermoproteota archaeon]
MINALQAVLVILFLVVTIILAWRLAPYLTKVFTRDPSRFDRLLNPIENGIYRISGVNPKHSMDWKKYFFSALLLNVFQMITAFLILTFQNKLPLNPQGFPGLSWDLAFHTVISFGTNTNLQHYNGETTLSIFSQMTAIQFLQFTSATTGLCVGIGMIRGFISGSKDLGNFHVDFIRFLTRILLPLCFIASIILVALGVPQTLNAYSIVKTIEGTSQTILVGPVASLVSIMQLGTNGGGYFGANAAHPFMNPSPVSNLFEMFLMMLLPTALIFVFGRLLGKRKEARPILIGAYGLFAIDLIIGFLPNLPIGAGIETRIGGFFSAFWTIITTAFTTGSVNASLSAMHPLNVLSGFMGMLIQATPGGKGVGLMYMIMYIIITVFIVGLMSGRTPEYLGFKITGRDMKLVMVTFLIHPIIILVPTVLAYSTGAANAIGVTGNSVGFTQILYEFTSSAANNGSDFLGASGNTFFFNISTGVVMFLGRYLPMFLLLALSGSMIGRRQSSEETGLKTNSIIFSFVLIASIIVLVVLTFFPFLALGPILSFFKGLENGFG